MSDELRKKTHVHINKIDNGYILEVYLAGTPQFGDGNEMYFPTIDEVLEYTKGVFA